MTEISTERATAAGWDMAASLVTSGAIDGDAFRAAHSEIVATFSKIQPFLTELRSATKEPDLCKHMEAVAIEIESTTAVVSSLPHNSWTRQRRGYETLAHGQARQACGICPVCPGQSPRV